MLPLDHRLRWDSTLLNDLRVRHFWDGEREIGRWYAENGFFDQGLIAWDVYYLFGEDAIWEGHPQPLLSSGYTVIGSADRLHAAIMPLLEQ